MIKDYLMYMYTCPNNNKYIGITREKQTKYKLPETFKCNTTFYNDILYYGWKNVKLEIINTNLTKEEANNILNMMIELYNVTYALLTNIVDKRYGARSEVIKEKIRNAVPKKAVIQLSLDGKIINKYNSTREAYRQTGIRNDYISQVCKHKRYSVGGYIWKYADEN